MIAVQRVIVFGACTITHFGQYMFDASDALMFSKLDGFIVCAVVHYAWWVAPH